MSPRNALDETFCIENKYSYVNVNIACQRNFLDLDIRRGIQEQLIIKYL